MAFKRNKFDSGNGYAGNPGDKWNETWNAPDYNKNRFSLSRYDVGSESTKVGRMGKDRISNLPEYTQDKVQNRSEVLAERQINKLNRQEDRARNMQGSDLTRRQKRLLGKGNTERVMKIAARKARRQARRDARNN